MNGHSTDWVSTLEKVVYDDDDDDDAIDDMSMHKYKHLSIIFASKTKALVFYTNHKLYTIR